MNLDKVVILLATYNGRLYIEEQLESIRLQTFQNYVCYIHDDGSKDGTREFVKSYCLKYKNHFCYVEGQPTGGAMNNFYYLLKKIEADYYFFSDQDDYWHPRKLERMLKNLKAKEKDAQIPYIEFCDLKVVDEQRRILSNSYMKYTGRNRKDFSPIYLLHRNYAPGCATLINRKLRDIMQQTDDYSKTVMHDWWGMLIASVFGKICYIDEPLVEYRQHGKNVLGAQKYMSLNKFKALCKKRKTTRNNIVQALELAEQLKLIEYRVGEHTLGCDIIDEYISNIHRGKIARAVYFYKIREHFTPMAAISNILFG